MTEQTNKSFREVINESDSLDNVEVGLVIGVDKEGGPIVIANNVPVPMIHWLLNRTVFKLNVMEDQKAFSKEEPSENPDAGKAAD